MSAATTTWDWKDSRERRWLGSDFWTNRLQDWEVREGALHCDARSGMALRTAHIVSYETDLQHGSYWAEVDFASQETETKGLAGLLIGAGAGQLDYRGAALIQGFPGKGGGILCAYNYSKQQLQIIDFSTQPGGKLVSLASKKVAAHSDGILRLKVNVQSVDNLANVTLILTDTAPNTELARVSKKGLRADQVKGLMAMAAQSSRGVQTFRFDRLSLGGEGALHYKDRFFGPVVGTLYSLNETTLKIGVQFAFLGDGKRVPSDPKKLKNTLKWPRLTAVLEMRSQGAPDNFKAIGRPQAVLPPDYYVSYRIEDWDPSQQRELRVRFIDDGEKEYFYPISIDSEPESSLTAGTVSCMGVMGMPALQPGPTPKSGESLVGRWTPANVWAPFTGITDGLLHDDADILFFTGDQLYESEPTWADQSVNPIEDFFYKFFIWHWSFQQITSSRPCILQTDDHDVYQGNIWGGGGYINTSGNYWRGGYLRSLSFVNMVQRVMTAHNPDAIEPMSIETGMTNYYTSFSYGGVDFFVLEDRKFKSNPSQNDVEQQELLGPKQEMHLMEWAQKESPNPVKCVISQTIYASISRKADGTKSTERDTNSWPPGPRSRLIEVLGENGVFVISGDQHLATFARVGVKSPDDGFYQFAAPPAGNHFWRWFYPAEKSPDDVLGEYKDGHGNPFELLAVVNPAPADVTAQGLRAKHIVSEAEYAEGIGLEMRTALGDGYGIIRFDHLKEQLQVEAWSWETRIEHSEPYPGWPITLSYEEL
ncbi:alkaline phosphatase D family protein [Rubellicoccus peritrichatus]|uniref:Alkaline phosphatase D family protein n=1 Tax=Rubellicoccus peritrichatus TaxID=3080537 RepID=A0AAQ3QUR4_9BACT|nr:alkaline phosphatase D family protein [Puniceicoccus sp. CR14]WOO40052.1 alkaline phosphatase D family protein [Puniceicoccus sp. CR14]